MPESSLSRLAQRGLPVAMVTLPGGRDLLQAGQNANDGSEEIPARPDLGVEGI